MRFLTVLALLAVRARGEAVKVVSIGLIAMLACAPVAEPEAAVDACATWNTEEFFKAAGLADVEACLLAGKSVAGRNQGGDSPICMAARFASDPEVINTLLRHGAQVTDWCAFNRWESNDCYGEASVLHVAARDNHNPAIFQALIDAGAQVNAIAGPMWTPLSVAWLWHNTDEVVDLLQRNGATGSTDIVSNPLC